MAARPKGKGGNTGKENKVKLRHCPFCATSNTEVRHNMQLECQSQVVCLNCGMRGPVFAQHDWAVEGWNELPRESDEKEK